MRGFEVVTSDDRVVGHVADMRDGYLIVESGHLRKARHPVPREFVHAVDEAAKAFVTVPRRVVMDAPEVDRKGFFDRRKAARHYGLAESYIAPTTEGAARRSATIPPGGPSAAAHPSIAGRDQKHRAGLREYRLARTARRPAHRPAPGATRLGGRELAEAVLGEAREDLLAADLFVVPGSVTSPTRFAFAASSPSRPWRAAASRPTHRSQRTPLTWIVSVWTAMRLA